MESPESGPREEVPDLSHDLDTLYNRLKLVIQTIQSPDETPDSIREELKSDCKSPLQYETEELKDTSTLCNCKCKEIFSGNSIRFCNVCGDSILVVNQILKSKLDFEDEVEVLEELIKAEKDEKTKLLIYNQELEERLENLEMELDKRCDKMHSLTTDLNAINAKYI
ncbi:hypothetical protein DSO57_1014116 [Entomophthora muscae]|uniref:Uncharacterized protein n=1 Tax=Entomophthora muscae TaxID=34485 RepID=A0ACC2UQB9_9FUNG|nr:hypothetical protein DSO57_1014116 [Entomophthora muscae]